MYGKTYKTVEPTSPTRSYPQIFHYLDDVQIIVDYFADWCSDNRDPIVL